jgi:hypothetical protein
MDTTSTSRLRRPLARASVFSYQQLSIRGVSANSLPMLYRTSTDLSQVTIVVSPLLSLMVRQ